VSADGAVRTPEATSFEHFLKEHEWGFGLDRRGRTLVYQVEHPVWEVHEEARAEVGVDFAGLYGGEWGMLNGAEPASVVLAVGSGVRVFPAGM
jgi:uncharacterized protein